MKHTFVSLGVGAAVMLPIVLTACGRDAPPASDRTPGAHVYLFVDQSKSPTTGQAPMWEAAADKAIDRLRTGDAITVFGLHDHTADASAIVDEATDPVPTSAGADEKLRAAKRLHLMKVRVKGATRTVLNDSRRSRWTDIFSAWDRVHPDAAGRHMMAILFTDGLHSMPDLDFERIRLTSQGFNDIIRRAATDHRWGPATLANLDVAFVLDGRHLGDAPGRIDPKTLRAFYDAMIGALGGRLIAFEPAPEQGGRS